MSKKTIDEYPDLYNIWKPPDTTTQQNDDTRAKDLIAGKLNDDTCARAYHKAWDTDSHLADATEAFCDSLWDINEGKKDIRNRS